MGPAAPRAAESSRPRHVMHRRHPQLRRRLQVRRQVVDEHALLRRQPDRRRAHRVDLGQRLADSDLAGDHGAVEELGEARAVVAALAPGVGDQAGADSGALEPGDRVEHRLVGAHAREEAVDQVRRVGDLQELGEQRLELLLGELSLLEVEQQLLGRRVAAEPVAHGPRLQALRLAEQLERREHVRRQDPAEVDEQAPARRGAVSRHARSPGRGARAPARPRRAA